MQCLERALPERTCIGGQLLAEASRYSASPLGPKSAPSSLASRNAVVPQNVHRLERALNVRFAAAVSFEQKSGISGRSSRGQDNNRRTVMNQQIFPSSQLRPLPNRRAGSSPRVTGDQIRRTVRGAGVLGVLHVTFALVAGTLMMGSSAYATSTIVNINGAGPDGSGVPHAYAYPVAPGSFITMVNPVVVNLSAGDYLISDGYGQPGALYDAWNYQLGAAGSWDSHFYAAVEQGTSSTYDLLIDGLSNRDPGCIYHNCSWASEAQASAAFLATPAFNLHLASDTAVSFSSTDYILSDNAGGMSLAITSVPAVPEPETLPLMAAGLLAVGFVLKRRATVAQQR
jgi:PEP-CTERM motif